MKIIYFIVCLLLVACSKGEESKQDMAFELTGITIGNHQNLVFLMMFRLMPISF